MADRQLMIDAERIKTDEARAVRRAEEAAALAQTADSAPAYSSAAFRLARHGVFVTDDPAVMAAQARLCRRLAGNSAGKNRDHLLELAATYDEREAAARRPS